jgi:hypothetical protein
MVYPCVSGSANCDKWVTFTNPFYSLVIAETIVKIERTFYVHTMNTKQRQTSDER